MLYDDFDRRKVACDDLKKIYSIRSKVVHTGALIDDQNLAYLAGGYARTVLITLIKLAKEFNGNFDNFITAIDLVKLGGNLNAKNNN